MFTTLGIIAKAGDAQVKATLKTLMAYLQQRRITFLCDATCADYLPAASLPIVDSEEMGRRCQLVISVGGDGTLLHAARTLAPYGTRLLGINLGRLGFLADISPAELERHLAPILAGDFTEEQRFLLRAEAWRGEEQLAEAEAFNDVVLHRWTHMVGFQTWIDGRFVSDQRADGLIVSTPTGSTAYGLSVGGPILHPGLQALLLIFICPHSLSNRPIVVDADSRIEVILTSKYPAVAQITCDGIACQEIQPGDKVIVRRHRQISLVHPPGHDYYAILRAKLHWGRTP